MLLHLYFIYTTFLIVKLPAQFMYNADLLFFPDRLHFQGT